MKKTYYLLLVSYSIAANALAAKEDEQKQSLICRCISGITAPRSSWLAQTIGDKLIKANAYVHDKDFILNRSCKSDQKAALLHLGISAYFYQQARNFSPDMRRVNDEKIPALNTNSAKEFISTVFPFLNYHVVGSREAGMMLPLSDLGKANKYYEEKLKEPTGSEYVREEYLKYILIGLGSTEAFKYGTKLLFDQIETVGRFIANRWENKTDEERQPTLKEILEEIKNKDATLFRGSQKLKAAE